MFGRGLQARPGDLVEPEMVPFEVILSDGQAGDTQGNDGASERPAVGVATLAGSRTTEILKMFKEALKTEEERPEFFQRPSSQPAPRSATPVKLPFPPTGEGPDAPDGVPSKATELKVLSVTPVGDTDRAPRLAVTFNSPMIAVSDPSTAEAQDPLGIVLSPRPKGSWRWLGTETLIFEPEGGEFPRASEYSVTIPAGTTNVQGQKLGSAVKNSFVLPRPKVQSSSPNSSSVGLEPLITLIFDQPVVRASTVTKIHLQKGAQEIGLRPLTLAEAEAIEEGTRARFEKSVDGTYLFFTPREPLSPGTSYSLVVDQGVVSQEGPNGSANAYTSSFSTYQPLKLTSTFPKEGEKISPFQNFNLNFNNRLDAKSFDPKWITTDPRIENLKVYLQGPSIILSGPKSGKTDYKVTVSGELRDQFGQSLGRPTTVTVSTDRAPKTLSHGFDLMTVVDPTVAATLPIYSTNIDALKLEVYKVTPKDWPAYLDFLKNRRRGDPKDSKATLPGERLASTTVSLKGQPDALVLNAIDLSQYLDQGHGNLIVHLTDPTEDKEEYRRREVLTWAQGTSLGLDLEVSNDQAIALVTKLTDGSPISGAEVKIADATATSQADGTATFDLSKSGAAYALVSQGDDQAFLPRTISIYGAGNGWESRQLVDEARWALFDDRGLYKPGEKAHVKGYVRQWTRGPKGQLTKVGEAGSAIVWTLYDPRGNKLSGGTTPLSAFGTVEFTVDFPPDTNLGNHRLTLENPTLPTGSLNLNVQEFRRPEFEVTTEVVSEEPHLLQESATVTATAAYYAGGALSGSTVDWSVQTERSSYTPPGRGDYTFGRWTPWWDLGPWWSPRSYDNGSYHEFVGQTDSSGHHTLQMNFPAMSPPAPTSVTATASVEDVNRQQRSGSSTLLVHPSRRYIGLKSEKSFVDEKSDFSIQAIVSDIDGNLQAGVPMSFTLLEVVYEVDENGSYGEVEKVVQTLTATSSTDSTTVTLSPKKGGTYRIRAEVKDELGRLNRTDYTMWKAGGLLPTKDKVEAERLTLVPDRKEYEPGQKAEILVMSPFAQGEGLVLWTRDGLLKEERFSLDNGTATLSLPLSDAMIPNVHVRVTVVGKAPWGKRERPALAVGDLNLSLSKAQRTLSLEISPVEAKLDPGAEVDLDVLVKDHAGKPVSGSEVTLWMVDEAVLGLVGYDLPQLIPQFYNARPAGFNRYHLRTAIALGSPDLDAIQASEREEEMDRESRKMAVGRVSNAPPPMPTAAPVMAEPAPEPDAAASFTVRKNFDALAVFKGALVTDASGHTKVRVKLPDNLTRYRIFSVAAKGENLFGSGDQLLTARLPVMLRPSLPRFLNFGDKAKLPVVIQNQTDRPLAVEVVGEATGVQWVGPRGQKVTVPANDRVEVQFEAQADQVGTAHFRFGVVAGRYSDAATLSLPVYTPASGEAFATYGTVEDKDAAISQPVRRPDDVWTQFGGLQVSLSSTALSELTDAFLYLYAYPFECAEQKASRVLSIAALREVLEAFNAQELPDPKTIEARMAEDIGFLGRLQNNDGGWQYWRRENESVPFVSVHVAHALVRAKKEGYKVDESTLSKSLQYLRQIEEKCRAEKYGPEITRSLTAYALYVRNLAGDADLAKAKSLFAQVKTEKNLNLEALGWLWPTLAEKAKGSPEATELERLVINRATETADKAQFTMSYGEGLGEFLLLHSEQRTDAVLLQALLIADPSNGLNTKLVRGLLAHRVKGRWTNTQENVWVLLALQKYFRTFEKEAPDFLARVWLEETYLGEDTFKGRSNKEAQIEVPMANLKDQNENLIIAKTGAGRLYYRIGMKYAPKSLRLPAESRGFMVERKFRGLDDDGDVTVDNQGDWTVKAGAKVEVELTMVVPERRYHVALVDPLPAGLEPLNPALLGTPPVSTGGDVEGERGWYSWWGHWYDHENLRDERAEVFATLLYPGVYTYRYTALATTPGVYVLPPTKAEEMYSPEVYGRTATARLQVLDSAKSVK